MEEGTATTLVLHQETIGTLPLLLHQLAEEVAQALQSHILVVKTEAQREVDVGGFQMHVDQAVDGGLHLSGIILISLGAHCCSARRS